MQVGAQLPRHCHVAMQWEHHFPSRLGPPSQMLKVPRPLASLAQEGRQVMVCVNVQWSQDGSALHGARALLQSGDMTCRALEHCD